jgi:hypothetical protein
MVETEPTEIELAKYLDIDQLVTIEINTTVNTLKTFLAFMILVQKNMANEEFEEALVKTSKAIPIIKQLLSRSVAGFQVHKETHQNLQLVTTPLGKEDSKDPNAVTNLENILKTIVNTPGTA